MAEAKGNFLGLAVSTTTIVSHSAKHSRCLSNGMNGQSGLACVPTAITESHEPLQDHLSGLLKARKIMELGAEKLGSTKEAVKGNKTTVKLRRIVCNINSH